jgi:hypothetical protein
MLRTWPDGRDQVYSPEEIPALWRRVADQSSWQQAQERFGPLDDIVRPTVWAEDWQTLHGRLSGIAKMWRPTSADRTLYALTDRAKLRRDEAASGVYAALTAMIGQHQLVIGTDITAWRPRIRAVSLRACLLADCAAAIDESTAYRRCSHCREWFTPGRADMRFCCGACKQAAWAARQAGGC